MAGWKRKFQTVYKRAGIAIEDYPKRLRGLARWFLVGEIISKPVDISPAASAEICLGTKPLKPPCAFWK